MISPIPIIDFYFSIKDDLRRVNISKFWDMLNDIQKKVISEVWSDIKKIEPNVMFPTMGIDSVENDEAYLGWTLKNYGFDITVTLNGKCEWFFVDHRSGSNDSCDISFGAGKRYLTYMKYFVKEV